MQSFHSKSKGEKEVLKKKHEFKSLSPTEMKKREKAGKRGKASEKVVL